MGASRLVAEFAREVAGQGAAVLLADAVLGEAAQGEMDAERVASITRERPVLVVIDRPHDPDLPDGNGNGSASGDASSRGPLACPRDARWEQAVEGVPALVVVLAGPGDDGTRGLEGQRACDHGIAARPHKDLRSPLRSQPAPTGVSHTSLTGRGWLATSCSISVATDTAASLRWLAASSVGAEPDTGL
ncbi:hypothetical protein FRACA_370012 [Frankia canadensis]|uniref:Uncharacterized protein n=1 Tax=Frankia canadensis TaxID=1836972 RepID=A0A2I2KVQ3_9ACTN|nr:hypothetical protein FRACA_370012 [Frankia canadensis]SOU57025.1 hypothetical protein FRACA_370012 [Frankia canadensis]